jgi:hypothetical protein
MSDPNASHRLKIKIGDAEFEAEGPSALVESQYAQFLEIVRSAPIKQATPAPKGDSTDPKRNNSELDEVPSEVPNEIISRIFKRTGDAISLLSLPRTENPGADALIALLYGYRRLTAKHNVTGVALMQAARQSGVSIDRVDRVIDAREDFLMIAGAKRGRTYGLNNRGVKFGEELIMKMVD